MATISPEQITLETERGCIEAIFHRAESRLGVIWLCGALGGLDGPSFGIFKILAEKMIDDGINSLRLHYSQPGKFDECVADSLAGIEYLRQHNVDKIALVGHSFGGAVAIEAGTRRTLVKAVVTLASQTYGAQGAIKLSPRPLLLIHGERDRNLPAACSEQIYRWAKEPKEIFILKNNGHFLREAHHELIPQLRSWLVAKLKAARV